MGSISLLINLIGRLLIYAIGKIFFGKSIKYIITDVVAENTRRGGKVKRSIKKHEYGHPN